MKILIWLLCVLVYSVITVAARFGGITLGGIPTVLLAVVFVFLPAPLLCKAWEKRKDRAAKGSADQWQTPIEERKKLCGTPFAQAGKTPPGMQPEQEAVEKWYTCQKCGQLVRDGEECDCSVIAQEAESKEQAADSTPQYGMVHKKWLAVVIVGAIALCAISTATGIYMTRNSGYDRGWSDGYDVAEAAERNRYERTISNLEEKLAEYQNEGDGEFSLDAYIAAKGEWKKMHDNGLTELSFDEWWENMQ